MIEAVLDAVDHGPVGKQRCPTLADITQDGFLSNYVQIGILLAANEAVGKSSAVALTYRIGIVFAKLLKISIKPPG